MWMTEHALGSILRLSKGKLAQSPIEALGGAITCPRIDVRGYVMRGYGTAYAIARCMPDQMAQNLLGQSGYYLDNPLKS